MMIKGLFCLFSASVLTNSSLASTPPPVPTLGTSQDPCYEDIRDQYAKQHPESLYGDYSEDFQNLTQTCTTKIDNYWGPQRPSPPPCPECQPALAREKRGGPPPPLGRNPQEVSTWPEICRMYNDAAQCIKGLKPSCGMDFPLRFIREVKFYFQAGLGFIPYLPGFFATADRICDGPNVKENLAKLISEGGNTDCIFKDEHLEQEFGSCVSLLFSEYGNGVQWDFFTQKDYYERLSASILRCYRDILGKSTCSKGSQTLAYTAGLLMLPPTVDTSKLNVDMAPSLNLAGLERCTIGVYGDPHLRLCDQPNLVTCAAPGQQVYLKNRFFSIFAANSRIHRGSQATAVSKIEINFSSANGSRVTIGQYSANGGSLPSVFSNNRATIGTGDDKIEIFTVLNNTNIRIFFPTLGLVMKIRRWNNFYFFNLRVAKSLVDESTGLLVTGCPRRQVLNAEAARRKRGAGPSDCEKACASLTDSEKLDDGSNIRGFRTACVFDCLQMASAKIANMTIEGKEEENTILSTDSEARQNAKTVMYPHVGIEEDDDTNSANTFSPVSFAFITFCALFRLIA